MRKALCVGAVLTLIALGISAYLLQPRAESDKKAEAAAQSNGGVAATEAFESMVSKLVECNGMTRCAVEAIQSYAIQAGPEAAIRAVKESGRRVEGTDHTCHSLYEYIARAVTAARGIVNYHNAECQFGYTHGVLYAMGKMYDDLDELTIDALDYCRGYIQDIGALNSPLNACYHGLGHALADITEDNPLKAADACRRAFYYHYEDPKVSDQMDSRETFMDSCADGVFMEYGDGNLVRVGLASQSGTLESTKVDPTTMLDICRNLDSILGHPCYARLWKFIGPGSPNRSETAKTCLEAKTEETVDRCIQGFGELFAWVENKVWPPETTAEADTFAKKAVAECTPYPQFLSCLAGVMSSTSSHLYAIGYDPELIPDPCKFVEPKYTTGCYERNEDARRVNWDKTSGADNETGGGIADGGGKLGR